MKAVLVIGAVFLGGGVLALIANWVVGLGMDPIGPPAEPSLDQQQAVAEGYAVLPPAPVIFEPMEGVFVPPVRR